MVSNPKVQFLVWQTENGQIALKFSRKGQPSAPKIGIFLGIFIIFFDNSGFGNYFGINSIFYELPASNSGNFQHFLGILVGIFWKLTSYFRCWNESFSKSPILLLFPCYVF